MGSLRLGDEIIIVLDICAIFRLMLSIGLFLKMIFSSVFLFSFKSLDHLGGE